MDPFDAEVLEALMGLKFAGHPGASPTLVHDIYNLPKRCGWRIGGSRYKRQNLGFELCSNPKFYSQAG